MRVSGRIGVGIALGVGLLASLALSRADPPDDASPARTRAGTRATDRVDDFSPGHMWTPRDASVVRLQGIHWLAAGGGPLPELNQVQIEQDLGLAADIFSESGAGFLLFAAGPDSPSVQVLAPEREPDPVADALADLFAPRGGRDATYRPTQLKVDGGATVNTVSTALRSALSGGDAPLLLYLAGHGDRAETPRDNTIDLWAQSSLTVGDLAAILDRSKREVRLVVTTCFSGGFAEIAFAEADPAVGPARTPRCGLFATTWDLEASGCDPNPDRAAQEGYGLHFLRALRGRDRDGRPLDLEVLDLDGDARISLLEAHTRVRLVSQAADVPTTTSERWLREVAPAEGDELPVALPEDDAVVDSLLDRLDLRDRPSAAFVKLQRLEDQIEAVDRELRAAQIRVDRAYREAAAELLARWPVLDDPWHPDFQSTLEAVHDTIATHLAHSASYAQYRAATAEVDRRTAHIAELRRQAAHLERLTRALDNQTLAARLNAQGGTPWKIYQHLLACERAVP